MFNQKLINCLENSKQKYNKILDLIHRKSNGDPVASKELEKEHVDMEKLLEILNKGGILNGNNSNINFNLTISNKLEHSKNLSEKSFFLHNYVAPKNAVAFFLLHITRNLIN